MKKDEFIRRYGEDAYEVYKEQARERSKNYREDHPEEAKAAVNAWQEEHRVEVRARNRKYVEENPEKIKANQHEASRKGGSRYDKQLRDKKTGLQGDRNSIRSKHAHQYKPYKDIIAPESQIHHEWVPDTSEYRGVALVETNQHMHGIVDVIEILAGRITLRTEEEIRKGKKKNE